MFPRDLCCFEICKWYILCVWWLDSWHPGTQQFAIVNRSRFLPLTAFWHIALRFCIQLLLDRASTVCALSLLIVLNDSLLFTSFFYFLINLNFKQFCASIQHALSLYEQCLTDYSTTYMVCTKAFSFFLFFSTYKHTGSIWMCQMIYLHLAKNYICLSY